MERVLVIGASGGIGAALVAEAQVRGADCVGLSRTHDGLDITSATSIDAAFASLNGQFDTAFVATGILKSGGEPEKALASIDAQQMADVFATNAIGPALILSHLPKLLIKTARIGVLSARVGSIGDNRIGGWHSYRASKSALNQIVRGAAIEFSRTHKGSVCVALHPGTVETPFTAKYAARHKTTPASVAASNLIDLLTSVSPAQTGSFFDYSGEEVPW